jgi:hypothetical protein
VGLNAETATAQLWKQFVPTARDSRSADERTAGPTAGAGDYALAQDSGPWLIVAASFSGEGGEEQAQALAAELRDRYNLRAYLHEMDFKLGGGQAGRGVDEYGAPIRRRLRREEAHEISVLVGDFALIDDPTAQATLERVKTLEPDALNVDAEKTSQSMAQVRKLEDAMLEKLGKARKRGPMAQAFFTRNPLLPREYFVPKGVDPFVAKMNEGVEHSLLDCPGRQTIKVATFRGKTILQASAQQETATKSFWGRGKNEDQNPLVEAAENAHLLTKELRSHGWEAYEFHDRTESIVTIGSFAQAAQKLPDGRIAAEPLARKIVETFDASYDTPADPLTGIGNDSTTQRLVDQHEQQFNLKLSSQQTQIVPGMNPKHVKIFSGTGKRRKLERVIPMDVHPQAIDVPRRSISSAYAQ